MSKYKRPLTDILDEIVSGLSTTITVDSVVTNADGTQTLYACDILYAQKGFNVTINGLSYKITAIDHTTESLTVDPNFDIEEFDPAIAAGITFELYGVLFFHGTPISTQTDLIKIKNADLKTPMIWLWENFVESIEEDEIVERIIPVELYALTQTPDKQAQMNNEDLHTECVGPMRRLIDNLMEAIRERSDLFDGDYMKHEVEAFPKFGIVARNKGAVNAVFMDNLSGVAGYTDLRLWYQDNCACPPASFGIGSMIIGQNFIVS